MQKEYENIALQLELQRLKEIWLEHETRMKAMEETWRKHMSLMQMSLEAACNILDLEKATSSHCYGDDLEDIISFGTPPSDEVKDSASDVSNLSVEFGKRRVVFRESVKFHIMDVELEQESSSIKKHSLEDELGDLKLRFEKWKKDYKARLRGLKARLQLNGDKSQQRP